jgi:hypothetical protein
MEPAQELYADLRPLDERSSTKKQDIGLPAPRLRLTAVAERNPAIHANVVYSHPLGSGKGNQRAAPSNLIWMPIGQRSDLVRVSPGDEELFMPGQPAPTWQRSTTPGRCSCG